MKLFTRVWRLAGHGKPGKLWNFNILKKLENQSGKVQSVFEQSQFILSNDGNQLDGPSVIEHFQSMWSRIL